MILRQDTSGTWRTVADACLQYGGERPLSLVFQDRRGEAVDMSAYGADRWDLTVTIGASVSGQPLTEATWPASAVQPDGSLSGTVNTATELLYKYGSGREWLPCLLRISGMSGSSETFRAVVPLTVTFAQDQRHMERAPAWEIMRQLQLIRDQIAGYTSDISDDVARAESAVEAAELARQLAVAAQQAAELAVGAAEGAAVNAAGQAALALGYAEQASDAAVAAMSGRTEAFVWAEGSDAAVEALGGRHSAKGWAATAQGGVWGDIAGDISDQSDLMAELDKKADLENGKVPAEQLPEMDYIPRSEKGAANGVAVLDANGKVASEGLPVATDQSVGVVKVNASYGVGIDAANRLTLQTPNNSDIDSRVGKKAITPGQLNYAVTAALTDARRITLTSEQQATAQEVFGVVPDDSTITKNSQNQQQAVGVKETNAGTTQKVWVGTLAEYTGQNKAESSDLCIITDDEVQAQIAVQQAIAARDQTQAIYDSVRATVAEYHIGNAYGYGLTLDGTQVSFTWTDPADNDIVKWAKTRLIYKVGGFPANETDGTVICDSTVRNQYKTNPFTYDMGVVSGYYFALFTQSTGGVWNTGDDAPRFTTDTLTWATIAMMTRAGTLLQYPNMAIGSVVPIQVNDLYPKMRYRLAHIDYKGTFAEIGDFMYDNTRLHNSIWIPQYLPCLGADNSNASMMQFDAPETSYGATWDTAFITGKAYYTVSGETYTQLTEGTDYQDGDSVADWQTLHGDTVYSKNHSSRVSYGNNIWKESNMRQWLNASGNDWFQKQNEYDVKSGNTDYRSGWLTGFVSGFLDLVMPVYNKTARNTTATISGGGGGGYDITLDTFWLPSLKEFSGSNVNNIAEGSQFAYFRDVATTNAQRIQYDEGGTARYCWLRSPYPSNVTSEYYIFTSGASSSNSTANNACAFLPAMCIA